MDTARKSAAKPMKMLTCSTAQVSRYIIVPPCRKQSTRARVPSSSDTNCTRRKTYANSWAALALLLTARRTLGMAGRFASAAAIRTTNDLAFVQGDEDGISSNYVTNRLLRVFAKLSLGPIAIIVENHANLWSELI
jgi:hypothetical protein